MPIGYRRNAGEAVRRTDGPTGTFWRCAITPPGGGQVVDFRTRSPVLVVPLPGAAPVAPSIHERATRSDAPAVRPAGGGIAARPSSDPVAAPAGRPAGRRSGARLRARRDRRTRGGRPARRARRASGGDHDRTPRPDR